MNTPPKAESGLVRANLLDGWILETGLERGCSRILKPNGETAVFMYRTPTTDEAALIRFGYEKGYRDGDLSRVESLKRILGIS